MAGENLAYEHFVFTGKMTRATDLTEVAVETAAGDITNAVWDVEQPISVMRFGVKITVAIDYDTTTARTVVALDRVRVYGGAATEANRVELARLTIPQGAVAGAVYYVDIPPGSLTDVERAGDCMTGDQIVAEIVTAGAGAGTELGDFLPFFTAVPCSAGADANIKNLNGVVMQIKDTTTTQV